MVKWIDISSSMSSADKSRADEAFALIFLAALIIVVLLIIYFIKKNKTTTTHYISSTQQFSQESPLIQQTQVEKQTQYRAKTFFFTKNELYFYRELLESTKEMNVVVFPKVRLADIIEPRSDTENWQIAFNKIKAKHIDFLLCESKVCRPKLAIELDDTTHKTAKRMARDIFVDEALEGAHIPILHVYGAENLKEKIEEQLAASFKG